MLQSSTKAHLTMFSCKNHIMIESDDYVLFERVAEQITWRRPRTRR